MNKKVCFVIMGYGVKTDHSTGRDLDLDKTYHNIIKPAAEEAGLECIRADEIKHSGTIDIPMYKYLVAADVVIADLSTNNSNAFYELGVRHALRPKTTIAIAETKLKPPFDINHTIIHQYEHLEKDIGYSEVVRFKGKLVSTINTILDDTNGEIDSPVYTYLKNLKPPEFNTLEEGKIDDENHSQDTLSEIIKMAIDHLNADEFIEAKSMLKNAAKLDSNNDFIRQKLALATYKSKIPSHVKSLEEALNILTDTLNLENTTDPETLGLAGAIFKRLWEELQEEKYLEKSIFYYQKGYIIKEDYYNGINLAFLHNLKATIQDNMEEALTDFTLANRIRKDVISICLNLYQEDSFAARSDQYWILATLEEAYYSLQDTNNYNKYKEKAKAATDKNWKRETTESQITKLDSLINDKSKFDK